MCGRFKRKSDKKKVARAFQVHAGLEEADFAPGDDLRPQSMQPVIYLNEDGERKIEMNASLGHHVRRISIEQSTNERRGRKANEEKAKGGAPVSRQ